MNAINLFTNISDSSQTYSQSRLYLTYAQFVTKAYSTAITNADWVIGNSRNIVSIQKAEWLKIKCMIALHKTDDRFHSLLESVSMNGEHLFQTEAIKLQERMTSMWRRVLI